MKRFGRRFDDHAFPNGLPVETIQTEQAAFIFLQHGELNPVDGQQFVQGEIQGQGGEDVNFNQGLPPLKGGAQGDVPLPVRSEIGPGFETIILFSPAIPQ